MIQLINFSKKAIQVLLLIFLFQACGFSFEERIQLNADYDITSISSVGSVGSPLNVQIYKNVPRYIPFSNGGGYYDNDANAILDAEVTLLDKTNDNQITLGNVWSRGVYTSTEFLNENAEEYELKIRTPEGGIYTATSAVPKKVEIATVDFEELSRESSSFGGRPNFPRGTSTRIQLSIDISFNDNTSEKNYYALLVEDNSSFSIRNDTLMRGFSTRGYDTNDPAFLNEEINVFGIVEENNVSVSSQPYYFSDVTFNSSRKKITINYNYSEIDFPNFVDTESSIIRFILFTVNEDYYRYITSIRRSDFSNSNPFAEPVPIYTNMSNDGQGIFTIIQSDTMGITISE